MQDYADALSVAYCVPSQTGVTLILHRPPSEPSPTAAQSLIVFDFDGTVCLGAGPVIAYAREIEIVTGATDIVSTVAGFLANPDSNPEFAAHDDPYEVVAVLAQRTSADETQRGRAFERSRDKASTTDIVAPDGLIELVPALRSHTILVTNSPAIGLDRMLATLGLVDVFDDVVASAGKPSGMHAIVAPTLHAGGKVLSIGDNWVNDLAPVAALGGSTALVDTFGRGFGDPDIIARSVTDLYPAIAAWDAVHAPARPHEMR